MNQPSSFESLPDDAFLRLKNLESWGITPFSRSTLWRKVGTGDFPHPIKVGSVTAWRVRDVRQWLQDPTQFSKSKSDAPTIDQSGQGVVR